MTAEALLEVMGDIRVEYVWEAEKVSAPAKTATRKRGWVKWAAVAACVVVAVLIAVPRLWGVVSKGGNGTEGPSGIPINSGSSLFGGANARMPYERDYLYHTYEELSHDYEDPVFEALETGALAQEHKITFGLVYSAKTTSDTEYLVEARVAFDAPSSNFYGEDVPVGLVRYINNETDVMLRENDFAEAEYYGTRTDYIVDGVEVQKYEHYHTSEVMFGGILSDLSSSATDPLTSYQERVSINDEWYYVYSADESLADALAMALAHIAAGS